MLRLSLESTRVYAEVVQTELLTERQAFRKRAAVLLG